MKLQPLDNSKPQLGFYKGNLAVPPGNHAIFDTEKFLKNINGRDYVVMKTSDGRTKLVPKNATTGPGAVAALKPAYEASPQMSFGYLS